jgi:hypothetical protein
MALVKCKYYYQSVRIGRRVTSRYVASGEDALLFAALAAQERRERAEAQALAAEQRRLYDAENARGASVRSLMTTGLRALGFRRWNRTRWRRSMKALARPAPVPASPPRKPTKHEARALMRKVRDDVPGALAEWRELVRAYPDVAIDAACSDLYELAIYAIGKHEFARSECARDGLAVKLRQLEADLVGPDAPPALRLTGQVVLFAWADHWINSAASGMRGVQLDDVWAIRRRDAACKRLLAAIKTHEQIRALHGRGPVVSIIR